MSSPAHGECCRAQRGLRYHRLLAGTAMMLAVSCASGDPNTTPCTAGQIKACKCTTGSIGTQTCSVTKTWGGCVCGQDLSTSDGPKAPDRPGKDSVTPDKQRPPDLFLCTCDNAIRDEQLSIGASINASASGKQITVGVVDIGVSGGQPSAALSIDGSTEVVVKGKCVVNENGFVVHVADVQNHDAGAFRWARVCITHPS
jgi:hypothetical protein